MAANLFGTSRRQLSIIYSGVMIAFLAVLIIGVHETMEWAITSEQARELIDAAENVEKSQSYINQHPGAVTDDQLLYKSTNDRLFFYVFDDEGRLLNFARASFRIEPFILDEIKNWHLDDQEVQVFTKLNENGSSTRIMMTSESIKTLSGDPKQRVYVGKDVTTIYSGLEKATYALAFLGLFALVIATVVGHMLSGRAMRPIKAAYEKQRQFAADASHELRTPLAVVMASAELLQNDKSIESPFLKQVIEDVHDEVKKMTKLVGDLLTVARSDNRALKLNVSSFDLAGIIEQTARIIQPLAEKKQIEVSCAEMKTTKIQADEQKIRQLVLIFVDNAVKYTPEGGKVTVSLAPAERGKVCFVVSDTGIGISKEDQALIFDRFFRVDKVRSREMGGNGLGLAIAREIINLHKGQIRIESELGKGTTFFVTLRSKVR
jgi:sensor histidine kinase